LPKLFDCEMLLGPLQRSIQVLIAWVANALEKGDGF